MTLSVVGKFCFSPLNPYKRQGVVSCVSLVSKILTTPMLIMYIYSIYMKNFISIPRRHVLEKLT